MYLQDMCIHMAVHEKQEGKFCEEHDPIEVSKVEVNEAAEDEGILVLTMKAYFHIGTAD